MGKLKGKYIERLQRFTGHIKDIYDNGDGTFTLWLEYLIGDPIYNPETKSLPYDMPKSAVDTMIKDAGVEEWIDLYEHEIFVYEANYEFASFDVLI